MKEYHWVSDDYARESDCPFKRGKCSGCNCLAWLSHEDGDDGRCLMLPAIQD